MLVSKTKDIEQAFIKRIHLWMNDSLRKYQKFLWDCISVSFYCNNLIMYVGYIGQCYPINVI